MTISNRKPVTIGVIIPTHNHLPYLEECINSVLNQTCKPSKIVICSDYSTDGTNDIIQTYEQRYPDLIKSVYHSKQVGIPANFNSGLQLINQDYISLVSGDDCWHPDKLLLEIERLRSVPEARWAYSACTLINENGKRIRPFVRDYDGREGSILFEVLTHKMALRNFLAETELIREVGLFDEKFTIFEDWDYKIRLAKTAKIAYVPTATVYYRLHGKGASMAHAEIYLSNLKKAYTKHASLINTLPGNQKNEVMQKKAKDFSSLYRRLLKGYFKKNKIRVLKNIPNLIYYESALIMRLLKERIIPYNMHTFIDKIRKKLWLHIKSSSPN